MKKTLYFLTLFLIAFSALFSMERSALEAFVSAKEEKKCLFFDLDDTVLRYSPVLSHLLSIVREEIIAEKSLDGLPETPTVFTGKEYEETMREAFIDFHELGSEKYMRLYDRLPYPMFPAIPESVEVLDKILDAGIPSAIVSNEKTKYIWWKLLQQVYTRENYPEELDLREVESKRSVSAALDELSDMGLTVPQKAWKDVIIKICNSPNFVIVGPDLVDGAKKPSAEMGLLALNKLNVDVNREIVKIYHFGDGETTDIPFARSLNEFLSSRDGASSCKAIHFGLKFQYLDYSREFDESDYEPLQETGADETVYSWARVGGLIRDFFSTGDLVFRYVC